MKKYDLAIVPDYPIKGVNFIDISGLLVDSEAYKKVINSFARQVNKGKTAKSAIITPESRGFLFAAAVAYKTGLPLVVIRKKGKVPNNPYRFKIQNEYDAYEMEIDADKLAQFDDYIYIDDILATGQTLVCVKQALAKKGKSIVLALHLTAVAGLKSARKQIKELNQIKCKEII